MQEDDIMLLTDADGQVVPCQLLDEIDLDGSRFAVLADLSDEDDKEGILIFRITDKDEYEPVEDENLQQKVFDVFVSSDEDYEFCDAE